MSASLSITTDDTGQHAAVLTCTNTQDGSVAQNVTIVYASDNPAVATVDPSSGAISFPDPKAVGTCNIMGTGTRGAFSHSDTGVLTVTQGDPNLQDFSVSLSLT